MKAEAIIFDKDGTLIDFDAFWVTVSIKAIDDVVKQLDIEDISVCEILEAFGIHDGVTDIEGILCKGTYQQMGEVVYNIVRKRGCDMSSGEVERIVAEAYTRNADNGEIIPTTPKLVDILATLKIQNIKLAVVTTDNEEITRKCLKKLGVEGLFDKIYTDDGKTPLKPDPYCVLDFCKFANINKECVVMVGDTKTDVDFAKNAGIPFIGIAKTKQNEQILSCYTDNVITDLAQILEIL